jgi:hypothetical protein
MKIMRLAGVVLPLVALLQGCAVTGPGEVATKWSCKLREMQITPVFPPREDLYVGDLYWLPDAKPGAQTALDAYCNWKPRDGFMEIGTHVGFIKEVDDELARYYSDRPTLPRTGTSTISVTPAGTNTFTIAASPRATVPQSGTDTMFKGKADRARLVGFPDFMSFQVRDFNLGAILPIAGVPTPFGASNSTAESAVISIPVAESYGLPLAPAMTALHKALANPQLCSWAEQVQKDTWSSKPGGLYMMLEVFYTRAIDVDIRARDGFAFSVARDREGATATTVASLPGGGTQTINVTEDTGEPQASGMADSAARNVFDMVGLRNGVPGVTLGYRRGGASQIGMRRLFDLPVAIGFRAVKISGVKWNGRNCVLDGMVVQAPPHPGAAAPAPALQ